MAFSPPRSPATATHASGDSAGGKRDFVHYYLLEVIFETATAPEIETTTSTRHPLRVVVVVVVVYRIGIPSSVSLCGPGGARGPAPCLPRRLPASPRRAASSYSQSPY